MKVVENIVNISNEAESLWVYSSRILKSNSGTNLPWHRGQSGHANPESVTLTIDPRVTCIIARNRVDPAKNTSVLCKFVFCLYVLEFNVSIYVNNLIWRLFFIVSQNINKTIKS